MNTADGVRLSNSALPSMFCPPKQHVTRVAMVKNNFVMPFFQTLQLASIDMPCRSHQAGPTIYTASASCHEYLALRSMWMRGQDIHIIFCACGIIVMILAFGMDLIQVWPPIVHLQIFRLPATSLVFQAKSITIESCKPLLARSFS